MSRFRVMWFLPITLFKDGHALLMPTRFTIFWSWSNRHQKCIYIDEMQDWLAVTHIVMGTGMGTSAGLWVWV